LFHVSNGAELDKYPNGNAGRMSTAKGNAVPFYDFVLNNSARLKNRFLAGRVPFCGSNGELTLSLQEQDVSILLKDSIEL
jgi:hypothetical protein